ncbi:hypothetical protein HZA56_03165 [Candidatus Poribacteria bacterium]|nr:hypothetical protein [Candidatus Poribacteria bacterium]
MRGRKRVVVFALVGLILLIAGSFIAVDWMIFLLGIKTIYAGVAKPVVSSICLLLVSLIGRDGIDRRDTALLIFAFVCIVPVDVLMSVVVFYPGMTVASPAFMVGGVLSIVADVLLIIRHGRGFPYLRGITGTSKPRANRGSFIWLPLLVYGIAVAVLIPLFKDMARVGHLTIGLVYSFFVAASMWVGWETVRQRLYPRLNAWMIGIGTTCWLITEITGEIYNIQIGRISNIAFNFVWIFYGTCIVCLALSGYRWGNSGG